VSAFDKWLWPNFSGDHPAQVGCIEEDLCANFISNLANFCDGVMEEIQ
jgi:hypothetical protein